ncbi:MAG: hypothetical protein VSS75_003705 [Candidatus Parabeggiatoa sp.]
MNLDLAAIRFQILAQKHTHFWVIIEFMAARLPTLQISDEKSF